MVDDHAPDRTEEPASPLDPILAALASIADDSPLPLAITEGKDHIVRYGNLALCQLAALPVDQILGQQFRLVLRAAPGHRALALLDRVLDTAVAGRTVDTAPVSGGPDAEPMTYVAWPILRSAARATGLVVQMSGAARIEGPESTADAARELQIANKTLLVAGLEAQEQAEAQTALATSLRELAGALDLSERRYRVRAAELQATIDGIEDGVAVLNARGDVIHSNQALARVLGASIASEAELRMALGGGELKAHVDARLIKAVDDRRWLEVRTFEVETDDRAEVESRVVMIRDVTEARLTSQARDAFIGVLSHELRTPVTTILGMSKLLDHEPGRPRDASRRGLSDDIAAESERLYRLVEDLLVLSRTEGGRLEIEREPVLVQHIVREAITAEAPRFANVQFVAELPPLPPVAGDSTYVRQIVSNLLNNAGKYGPDGPCVVRVTAEHSGGELVVRVVDEGPGFPAAEAERLFELFFRTGGSTRHTAGAGIGLYVARALAEAMGGRVWATTLQPRGAEFGFALPVMADDGGSSTGALDRGRRKKPSAPPA